MIKSYKLKFILFSLFSVFIVPLPLVLTLYKALPSMYMGIVVPIMLGLLAYTWMLVSIYLGTKPRWIANNISLPHLYLLHGILSVVAIIFAYLHKENTSASGLLETTGELGLYIIIGIGLYSMFFLSNFLASRIPILGAIKKFIGNLEYLGNLTKHEIAVWLHRLNIIATLAIFWHIQLIDYLENQNFLPLLYFYTVVVMAKYLYYCYKTMNKEINAKLVKKKKISFNVYELTIILKAKQKVKAGDFVFVSFPTVPSLREPHPFSIVKILDNGKKIVLAIRGDGDFTRIIQNIEGSLDMKVSKGYGIYQNTLDKNKYKKLIIISGGIGITPMISIIENNPDVSITLFYSASREDNIIYREELMDLSKQRDNLNVHIKLNRFDKETVFNSFQANNKNDVLLFISGPTAMGRYWVKELKDFGINADNIYYEEFNW